MKNEVVSWIVEVFGGEAGKILGMVIISMMPVIESRGSIPVAFALGLDWKAAFACAVIGNILPVPFILMFLESVFNFMKRNNIFGGLVEFFEKKAAAGNEKVMKYKFWGLLMLGAIPLPGTGAWMGALIASVMKMDKLQAFISIALGLTISAVFITALAYGLVGSFIKW